MVFHTMAALEHFVPPHASICAAAPTQRRPCPPVLITTLSVEHSTPSDSFPPSLCARTQDVYGEEA